MKKNYLQDVIPPNQKRSIRDIPLPNNRDRVQKEVEPKSETSEEATVSAENMGDVKIKKMKPFDPPEATMPPNEPPREARSSGLNSFEKPKRKSRKLFYIIIILLILGTGWFLNRSKAEVIVYAKSENTFAQNEFDITNKDLGEVGNSLGYKVLKIEKQAQTIVEPTGEEEVSQKASGMIRVFNEYSSEGQRLVERTRFESKNGNIYRIAESITVPGYEEVNGQIVAGEIEVEVFADEEGEDYNIEKTDFVIPGFEGLPQYDSMWAESVSDMTGGFIGVKKIVSEESKSIALETLREEAKKQIISEINNSSDEFTIVFNEEDINYSGLNENDLKEGVELKITASVEAYVFNTKELARKITDVNIMNASEGEVVLANKEALDLSIIETEIETEEEEVITREKLSVEGDVEISWVINTEEIKKQLKGKKRNQFSEVISTQNGVSKAEVSLSPLWKNTFPKESKIEILIQK